MRESSVRNDFLLRFAIVGLFTALASVVFVGHSAFAQSATSSELPPSRPKYTDELNKDSSSFIGDPDSLDPLPLKKESLKDDEEPVLEDIKSILKDKSKPAKPSSPDTTNGNGDAKPTVKIKTKKTTKRKKIKSTVVVESLNPDDPNYELEKKFNDIYNKYNAEPTSEQMWGAALSKVPNVYVIQSGDTLSSISRVLFGDMQFWPKIWAQNNPNILNPHELIRGAQINFYPGTATAAPSVSLQSQPPLDADMAGMSSANLPPKPRDYTKQNTEFEKMERSHTGIVPYQEIPASLPVVTNFRETKMAQQMVFDLHVPQFESKRDFSNPFILSSIAIKPDYKISEKEAESLVCLGNQYVPSTIKLEKDAKPGIYNMLMSEQGNLKSLKKTHAYRLIGKAKVDNLDSMRIENCISTLTSDLILVSDDKLLDLKPPTEILPNTKAQIIEGLDVYGQQFFYSDQFVILNTNQMDILEGQDLKIYSAHVDRVVGEVKILKRTGTLGIGYIISNDEVVRRGDKVLTTEQ